MQTGANDGALKVVKLLTKKEVCSAVSLSYVSVWKLMRQGRFPRSKDTGAGPRWCEDEIAEWVANLSNTRLKGDPIPRKFLHKKKPHPTASR
jgi:predicted DNA-binding transcriptional regulator AlpA